MSMNGFSPLILSFLKEKQPSMLSWLVERVRKRETSNGIMFHTRTARNLAPLHHDQQRGLNCFNLIYLLLRIVFSYPSQQIKLEGKEQHPQWFTDCWWYQMQLPRVKCFSLCCTLLLQYPQQHTWAGSPAIIQPPRLQSPLSLLTDHDPC